MQGINISHEEVRKIYQKECKARGIEPKARVKKQENAEETLEELDSKLTELIDKKIKSQALLAEYEKLGEKPRQRNGEER